jgi:hypothetical protein
MKSKERRIKHYRNNKMAGIPTYLPIVILNVNVSILQSKDMAEPGVCGLYL